MQKALLVPLALLAVVPTAHSQQAAHEFGGARLARSWPSDLGAVGAFGRSAAGDFDRDGVQDAVVLDGDRPVLLLAPADGFAPSELALQAADVDVLPGGAGLGHDAVVAVAPDGLHAAWIDPLTGTLAQVHLEGGPWAGAAAVRAADLDGDGTLDLVGLAADRERLLLKRRLPGTALALAATQVLESAHPVRELVALRFDGDAAADLALLSDWGVEVLSQSGALLQSMSSVLPGGAIARLRQEGALRERLAWVTTYAPPAQQWLAVLSTAGVEQLLDVGALDATSLLGADYDGDGDDDLMIGQRSSHDLVCLINQRSPAEPAAASFAIDEQTRLLFRIPAAAVANTAWPALADFDGDGDLDVVQAVEASAELHVMLGEALAEDVQRPGVSAASFTPDTAPGRGTLRLVPVAPSQLRQGATHLEALVWRQAHVDAALDQFAVDRVLLPSSGGQLPAHVDLELPEAGSQFGTIYWITLRMVELDGDGAPLAAHPAWHGVLAFDDAVEQELAQQPEAGQQTPVTSTQGSSQGSGGSVGSKSTCDGTWSKNAPPVKSPAS